ncbi:hypothetical protein AB2S62_18715 [Vibrio sp. NTOU-M3]|uniref:hypothetical protein n=1 Tax=Vibrio sp. NTOU-M3 TaxID=3234954 RepID=UPI00349FCB3C
MEQAPSSLPDKRRSLALLVAIALGSSVITAASYHYWQQNRQAQRQVTEQQIESAVMAIQSGDVAEGALALARVDFSEPDLAYLQPLADRWSSRLIPAEQVLDYLKPYQIYSWGSRFFYLPEQGTAHFLPERQVVTYTHDDMGDTLYVLSLDSQQQLWLSIYRTRDFTLEVEYPLDDIATEAPTFIALAENDSVFLSAHRMQQGQSNQYPDFFKVTPTGLEPMIRWEAQSPSQLYASEQCDSAITIQQNKIHFHQLSYELLTGNLPKDFYDIGHGPVPSEAELRKALQAQIDTQGLIYIKDDEGISLYNRNVEFVGQWVADGLTDWCSRDQSTEVLRLPQVLAFESQWQTTVESITPQQDYAMEQLQRATPTELLSLAKNARWDLTRWGIAGAHLLVDAILTQSSPDKPWPKEADNLRRAREVWASRTATGVVLGGYQLMSTQTAELTYCLLDEKRDQIQACHSQVVYTDMLDSSLLSPSGRWILTLYAGFGGQRLTLMESNTMQVKATQEMPYLYVNSKSHIAFSPDESHFALFDDESVYLYQYHSGKLQLAQQFNTELYDSGYDQSEPLSGGFVDDSQNKSLVFVGNDRLLYREKDDRVILRNIQTGLRYWQATLNLSDYGESALYFLLDEDNDQVALYTAEGVQLLQLSTGYPLTPFTYFIDIEPQDYLSDDVYYHSIQVSFEDKALVVVIGALKHILETPARFTPLTKEEIKRITQLNTP